MKQKVTSIIALLLAFSLGVALGYLLPRNQVSENPVSQIAEEPGSLEIADSPPLEETKSVPEEPTSQVVNELLPLQETLQAELADCEGDWAIYVEALSDGDFIEINNKKMVSASLIKLFVMGKVFEEIENGVILEEQVETKLHQMITVSDNESTNDLVAILGGGDYTNMEGESFQAGMKQVNAYANELQFHDTELQRDLKNSRPKPIPEQNYTSVADCGKFLSALYQKQLVSEEADTKMMDLLKAQTRTGKIPKGLPEGTVCANKTGELSNVENDAAIVFSPGGDYVICVMANNVSNTAQAREKIVYLSEIVYEYFN